MAPRESAWRREAEALIVATLGAPVAYWIDGEAAWPPPGSTLPNLVLSMVGQVAGPTQRLPSLARVGDVLAVGGTLVLVDHNRPRGRWQALRALLGPPWVPGVSPTTRWKRLAYPAAREGQDAGFRVDRLRFAAGERVQIVFARRIGD